MAIKGVERSDDLQCFGLVSLQQEQTVVDKSSIKQNVGFESDQVPGFF